MVLRIQTRQTIANTVPGRLMKVSMSAASRIAIGSTIINTRFNSNQIKLVLHAGQRQRTPRKVYGHGVVAKSILRGEAKLEAQKAEPGGGTFEITSHWKGRW